MPHNRIRMWVGLAIAAVTIPAVGQYFYRPGPNDERAQALLRQARWNATTSQLETRSSSMRLAKSPANRDYLAEVNAAVGRQGTVFAGGKAYPYDNGPDYAADSGPLAPEYPAADYRDAEDEMYDINPLDDGTIYADDGPPVPGATGDPNRGEAPLPNEAYDSGQNGMVDDGSGIALTDGAVYATVVNNLPPDDRDEFVRAWAVMTPDQRADLLDGFRQNLQGGNP